jgi:hypothetical protein
MCLDRAENMICLKAYAVIRPLKNSKEQGKLKAKEIAICWGLDFM